MKKFTITICLIMFGFYTNAQQNIIKKVKTKNNLTEVNIYYENGNLMQHGFYTEKGELHNSWESYNSDGSKKCFAFYNKGKKIGTWTYWDKGIISKVKYENDKIISIKEFTESELIKTEI